MIRINRLGVVLAAAAALAACSPKTEVPEDASADETPAAEASGSKLLEACKIKMTQPVAHEWTTYWDPAHSRTVSQNPSGVLSVHWGNEHEKKVANDMGTVIPLELGCGSDDRVKPVILLNITAFDSSMTDVRLAPGTYVIAPKASPARNKPGEFIVAGLFLDDGMFEARSGTLKIDRFDMNGVKGSFVIDGNEILMGSRPLHVEGTFEMPCRDGQLQSACTSGKAEPP